MICNWFYWFLFFEARGEEHGRPPVAAIPGSTGTGSIGAFPRGGARWGFGMNKLQFGFSLCVDCWIIRYWAPPLCKHELVTAPQFHPREASSCSGLHLLPRPAKRKSMLHDHFERNNNKVHNGRKRYGWLFEYF
ncbi:uncharacterized protein LOC124669271 [Lolium rigidum]|uniref:uncharacterized protein LOC124669271 n=1 Tax=Lolium rigidum TaxID=89674 RepID=UPI001F5C80B9|nr:uncharacterized protein LOC124669271 [Lolium rigidum]